MRLQIGGTLDLIGFLLELFAKLPRHRARASDPSTDRLRESGQLLRAQNNQRDHEDHQDLGKVDSEHCAALSEEAPVQAWEAGLLSGVAWGLAAATSGNSASLGAGP